MTTIRIQINGTDVTLNAQSSISQALNSWLNDTNEKTKENYVIALNQTFVPRDQWQNTLLQTGDEIELLSPMAGG